MDKVSGSPKYQTADAVYYDLLKDFAKENRRNPTEAESIMWMMLCSKGLDVKFRRQHIIGQFIADFVSLRDKLIIEIDGAYHNYPDQMISDAQRTEILNGLGFRVIRFTNSEVLCDTDNVLDKIKNELKHPK